jgi:hypothetical protein
MKITKSELKEMIREALREELKEGAMNGGQAESGFRDTYARAGGPTKKWKDALEGKKTKTVKAKDLKPGMITSTGEVQKVTSTGWDMGGNHKMVEISYGGIGTRGSYASDNVPEDRDYEVLDESMTNDSEDALEDTDEMFEGIFDFGKKKREEEERKRKEAEAKRKEEEERQAEQERQQGIRRAQEWNDYERRQAEYKRQARNYTPNIKTSSPSNTQYSGVNYSGGDYF